NHDQDPKVERKPEMPVMAVVQDENQTKVDSKMIQPVEQKPLEHVVAQQPAENEPHHTESDERPIMAVKADHGQDIPQHKNEPSPRHADATPVAWKGMSQDDTQSNPNWSGREQGDRQSSEQHAVPFPAMTNETSPTTQPHPGFMVGTTDPKSMPAVSTIPSNQQPHQATPAPVVQPTDWMPAASPTGTRSMVLEVSQADLGRVNIRVAVNQDIVHTHFSSDRGDMGQYLANGQDKLQAALQTSGLDLGQFRVDIDRQSAGRSFQQQASHDQHPDAQSQGHGQGQPQDQHHQSFHRDNTPRRGMLNLVA
ncbi:MAG: flagellar hook-length control protein FliK, partial [Nitrospira sp.]